MHFKGSIVSFHQNAMLAVLPLYSTAGGGGGGCGKGEWKGQQKLSRITEDLCPQTEIIQRQSSAVTGMLNSYWCRDGGWGWGNYLQEEESILQELQSA